MSFLDRARRFLSTRRTAYIQTFRGPVAQTVLKDLAVFCFANASTFDKDKSSEQNLVAQGRREVWLRIANHLHLSPDELWALYDGRVDDDTA